MKKGNTQFMPELIVRYNPVVADKIETVYRDAFIRMIKNHGVEYTNKWCIKNGFALNIPPKMVGVAGYKKHVRNSVSCVFLQGFVEEPTCTVYIRLSASSCGAEKVFPEYDEAGNETGNMVKGKVKYASCHIIPIPFWDWEVISGTNYCELFMPSEIEYLGELFLQVVIPYHHTGYNFYQYTGTLCNDGLIIGSEPELMLKRGVSMVQYEGVPLNMQGMFGTAAVKLRAHAPKFTKDATVDVEILIKPIAGLQGFRDSFCSLQKLFDIRSREYGSHVHVSELDATGTTEVWNNYDIAVRINLAKTLFNAVINRMKEYGANTTMEIFGRDWGVWCGDYVGVEDHSSGVNVSKGHLEFRLCKYQNEAQYLKVIQMVSEFARVYSAALKSIIDTDTAIDRLSTIWENYINNNTATDTNSKIATVEGSRKRNRA